MRARIARSGMDFWAMLAAAALATLLLIAATQMEAQTLTTIHTFSGHGDGSFPIAGLTIDRGGNLYGTASGGGTMRNGTAFKLTRSANGWILNPIYTFTGGSDGGYPNSRIVFGADGTLYGTALFGGEFGSGVVYSLQPPASTCESALCPWVETVLYSFPAAAHGVIPSGDLIFDRDGNLYGATQQGGGTGCGGSGCGTVYKLSRSGGGWALSASYVFQGADDGGAPVGVTLDGAGNLYGAATNYGAHNLGTIFLLTPDGSGFSETTLHAFQELSDGEYPASALTFDSAGNLYGNTEGGPDSSGVVFEMTPSGGGWNFVSLAQLPLLYAIGPIGAPMAIDPDGNLLGTISSEGYFEGAVFEITSGGGTWILDILHSFTGSTDGAEPFSNVVFDSAGNLYGTASVGGSRSGPCAGEGCGVVWEIAP
jgi:uncharacterized repeat protein (TIGR03803 family)